MTTTRRKISVSIDEDIALELERSGESLSMQVNQALRDAVEVQRRQRKLDEFLDHLEADTGPADEELVARFDELLA